ncbi:MAG: DUF4097 family beta strand repeat protein [Candidatus Aminicenantes bacterium]|nr:DUF4097 family beta strand repeat protein [Candidatus Aminicenantes bacterium]
MNKKRIFLTLILGIFAAAAVVYGQENTVDRAAVPLSDPSQPAMVKVSTFRGAISVKGYNGQDVIVEAQARSRKIEKESTGEKARGMKLIPMSATGLTVTEESNEVNIKVESLKYAVDLTIQVPVSSSLKVSGFNEGDILVENISGEIEATNHNGGITLTGISGNVIANTFNGELLVTFKQIDPDKPMAFSSFNGDVDVTFPGEIKADVKMKSEMGDIYSDYEIQIMPVQTQKKEEEKDEEGRYQISFDKTIFGKINGGGPEYTFKNFNGDIYIRKAK